MQEGGLNWGKLETIVIADTDVIIDLFSGAEPVPVLSVKKDESRSRI
jgi:hypothetical protein